MRWPTNNGQVGGRGCSPGRSSLQPICLLDSGCSNVSTGTGEAALAALPVVGPSGVVVGADVSIAMLEAARRRVQASSFWAVAADGQLLPFADQSFDAVICHLGLQFFANPIVGLMEFRRVLRAGRNLGLCVISTADHAPMWGVLAGAVGRRRPDLWKTLHLSFALDDPQHLESLLRQAGFDDVRVKRETRDGTFREFRRVLETYRNGRRLNSPGLSNALRQ